MKRGGRVDRMEQAVLDRARTARLVAEREKAFQTVARIEGKAASAVTQAQKILGEARARADHAKSAFGASMAETYANPSEAARAFLNDAQTSGTDRAAQRMSVDPERYGALRATPTRAKYSLVRATTTEPARAAAPLAAKHGRSFVEARASVGNAEAAVRQAGEVHRTVSSELSGVHDAARQASVDTFGPGAVRVRLERLDNALRKQSARAPGIRVTPQTLSGPAGSALRTRVGSAGLAVAESAAKAAGKSVGRGE